MKLAKPKNLFKTLRLLGGENRLAVSIFNDIDEPMGNLVSLNPVNEAMFNPNSCLLSSSSCKLQNAFVKCNVVRNWVFR